MSLLALLVACTGAPPADTSEPPPVEDEQEDHSCDTLEIRIDGNDPPAVGDTWTMFLWCDDALLTGAYRVIWEPNDIATVSNNVSEFLYAGEATLTLQAGSRRQTRDVTVLE